MICSKVPVRAWFATLSLGCFGLVAIGMALQTCCDWPHAHSVHFPAPALSGNRAALALIGFVWPAGRLLWSALDWLCRLMALVLPVIRPGCRLSASGAPNAVMPTQTLIERLVDWLGMQWPSLFLATGFCTSREWVFLGLSMANWSMLIFAGIAGYAALFFARFARRRIKA
jgi:disulfide bond formation protein DsbB